MALLRVRVPSACGRWGQAYLTREFFQLLGEAVGDSVLLVVAEDSTGRMVGGALNLVGGDALYGRNWGCLPGTDFPFLHFEACYYQVSPALRLRLLHVGRLVELTALLAQQARFSRGAARALLPQGIQPWLLSVAWCLVVCVAGHRGRDRAGSGACGGGRAGGAQDPKGVPPHAHLLGTLHPRHRLPLRCVRLPAAREDAGGEWHKGARPRAWACVSAGRPEPAFKSWE